jgi:hydrogenase maturation protease
VRSGERVPHVRILIAGVGNVLRADDAFGVEVAKRLAVLDLPEGVTVVETGIAGIALVQELQDGYDALVVVDAVDLGRHPGNVMLIDPDVVDVNELTWAEKHDLLADMHLATPGRAMMLAKALGVLPGRRLLVGCQPVDPDSVGTGMSAPVTAAVGVAVDEILRHVEELLTGVTRQDSVLHTAWGPAGPEGPMHGPDCTHRRHTNGTGGSAT